MEKNRRANAVMFGFDFQVNAAIILMLENIKELRSLKLEGNYEDIELSLVNEEYILAQAKAIEKSSTDFTHVRSNLKKALISLSEGAKKSNARKLILITNSPNPLNQDETRNLFWGPSWRLFSTLPESSQKLINNYLSGIADPLDTEKFMIQVLPFETDDEQERYKVVKQAVDDFVGELQLNVPGIGKRLMHIWKDEIFTNGTKRNDEIHLDKKDIIWPILVLVTDAKRYDDDFSDFVDSGLYDEIINRYQDVIDSYCQRCEFFIRVLCDYNEFTSSKRPAEKPIDFALSRWENYIDELTLKNADSEIQKGLIQIILYSIVRNRYTIDRIKKGVGM